MKVKSQGGFSAVEGLLIFIIAAIIGGTGWYVVNANKKANDTLNNSGLGTTTKPSKKASSAPVQSPQTDPTANWASYSDTQAGVKIKYSPDWKVDYSESKAWAWRLVKESDTTASINARWIVDPTSKTAKQEWDTCQSLDACGHASDEKSLEDKSLTINNLNAYEAKMQGDQGIYHATVIKSSKKVDSGSIFVEFIIYSNDTALINTYDQIVATVTSAN